MFRYLVGQIQQAEVRGQPVAWHEHGSNELARCNERATTDMITPQ